MLFNIVVLLWTEASVALSYTEFAARQNVKNLFKIAGLDVFEVQKLSSGLVSVHRLNCNFY